MWGTSTVVYLIYYRLLNHQMHYMTAFPWFTAPGWSWGWGLAKVTAPSPLLLHDNMKYNTCTRKKSICGISFLIPLPVTTNYKKSSKLPLFFAFLPEFFESRMSVVPIGIYNDNNEKYWRGARNNFPLSISLSYNNIFPLISQQGSYNFSALKFKDFQGPHF